MFRYMIDLSRSLSVSELRLSVYSQNHAMDRIRDEASDFLDSLNEELAYEFQFAYMYLKSVRDYWLVMAKLHDKKFYQGIVSTEIILLE